VHAKAPSKTLTDESGFSLIELLVVIMIVGILAAIAIPAFLNQTAKAADAAAKELAHDALVAEETCASDHGGQYANCKSTASLASYESTIQTSFANGNAYLSSVSVPGIGQAGNSFSVTATATNNDTYTLTRSATGQITRSCSPAGAGACSAGNSW
jgi:type IV pilus assembly protein PilA